MHLMRVFYTGAFRKPRELTWIVGLILLFTALLEGYMGYSLVDDLLSGWAWPSAMGGAVDPSDRRPGDAGDLRRAVSRRPSFESRLYIAHVLLVPVLLATLSRAPGAGDGAPPHPVSRERAPHPEADRGGAAVPRAGPAIAGADVLRRRPAVPARRAHPDQPDLAVGPFRAVAGHQRRAARLVPGLADRRAAPDAGVRRDRRALHRHSQSVLGRNPVPAGGAGRALAVPWAERRVTGDRGVHNLADRPRDAPGGPRSG